MPQRKASSEGLASAAAAPRPARPRRSALVSVCALSGLALLGWAQGARAQEPAGGAAQHRDMIQTYCVTCHNVEDWAGGVAYDAMDLGDIGAEQEIWETAVAKLRGRLMPPAGEPQPSQDQVDAVVAYLETSIDAVAAKDKRIGHVPIQRLNRTELAASVKGLIGVDLDPEQILPTEIEVEGFDNIAGALTVSPAFLEQYMQAARLAARLAVGDPVPKVSSTTYFSDGGNQRAPEANQTTHRDGFPLGTRGGMKFTHVFPTDGEYRFNVLDVDAGLYPRGVENSSTLVILIDGREVARREVGGPKDLDRADRDGPEGRDAVIANVSGIPAQVTAGPHEVTATFIERSWAESNDLNGGGRLGNMPRIQDSMEVEGPFQPGGLSLSESRAKIFVCQPASEAEERPCAEKIARHLATEAFRRPATDADVAWLMPFYETGRAEEGGFDSGVRDLVAAILSSPDFLYRAILTAPEKARPLDGLELASRLSFFLWSQGPDDELIQLAAAGKLSDPAVTKAQVERMLADPRAQALVENFALAWLNLDELDQVEPQDPAFNGGMRKNFETEIRLFLSSVLLEGKHSVLDLLTADWTFVNQSLARQYDIPGVYGPQFRRVTLTDDRRFGLLGKGAFLLRTSYGDRTSPVLRGAWVLDRIVGTPPTPPPPNVNTDITQKEGEPPKTVRARLEKHREDPSCNACHGLIDPFGLVLENYDVTGKWRDVDVAARGAKIDPTTTLTSGIVLHTPAELRAFLTRRPDQFATTVTKRLMMYGLNREIEYYDMPEIRAIVKAAAADDYSFASIVTGIVGSDAFRFQGPEEPVEQKKASLETGAAATP